MKDALVPMIHRPTWLATLAERAVSRALGGSCSVPLAAHARWEGAELSIAVALGHAEHPEAPLLKSELRAVVQDEAQADALGQRAAQALRDLGAGRYLAAH